MKSTTTFFVKTRPIRLGLCVEQGDVDSLRTAIKWNSCLWGGYFNPIIPISDDPALARSLVKLFHVDILLPVRGSERINRFIAEFSYLPWPFFQHELFLKDYNRPESLLLDVTHPILRIREDLDKPSGSQVRPFIYDWDSADPLSDVFLATFGKYPSQDEIGIDLLEYLGAVVGVSVDNIPIGGELPHNESEDFVPLDITQRDLILTGRLKSHYSGLYIGSGSSFDDLVNFWNLRAAGIDLEFFDPNFELRFTTRRENHLTMLRSRFNQGSFGPDLITLWSSQISIDPSGFGTNVTSNHISDSIWNGLNVLPLRPVFESGSVLAGLNAQNNQHTATFQLANIPIHKTRQSSFQSFAIDIRQAVADAEEDPNFVFPNVPEINEFLGRAYFHPTEARVSANGLGLIVPGYRSNITLSAPSNTEKTNAIFHAFGMETQISKPGLIAKRIITQMGSLQACRVFKISGVRKLIREISLRDKSVTRGGATVTILEKDPDSNENRFKLFEDLSIEYRTSKKLTPSAVFEFLGKRGVLTPGLRLECPNCFLSSWVAINELANGITCKLCNAEFIVFPQLKDRDWAYRLSGLFVYEDNQGGSIPVVLTLQQLHTVLRNKIIAYTTAFEIESKLGSILKCESDLAVLVEDYNKQTQLLIGECKTNGKITEDDVRKLTAVADQFEGSSIEPYIIFSKLSQFSEEELEICKRAQTKYRARVILLTERELEPYHVYELREKEFDVRPPSSLKDLAYSTVKIFFQRG